MLGRCSKNITISRPFGRADRWAYRPLLSTHLLRRRGWVAYPWSDGVYQLFYVWEVNWQIHRQNFVFDISIMNHCMVTPSDQRKHRHHMLKPFFQIPTNLHFLCQNSFPEKPYMEHRIWYIKADVRIPSGKSPSKHLRLESAKVDIYDTQMTTFIDDQGRWDVSDAKPWVFDISCFIGGVDAKKRPTCSP